MDSKIVLDFLEQIESDYDFIDFLINEEKFEMSYDNFAVVVDEIDNKFISSYEIEECKNCLSEVYDRYQNLLLKRFGMDEEDISYINSLDDFSLLDILDENKEIKDYIASRVSSMNFQTINFFLYSFSQFERKNYPGDAWFNSSKMVKVISEKIRSMDFLSFIMFLTSSYDLFSVDDYLQDVCYVIDKMNDLEFNFFRHIFYYVDLNDEELDKYINDRSEKVENPFMYFDDFYLMDRDRESIEKKASGFKDFDFSILLDTSSSFMKFKNSIDYINNNLAIVLFMLNNPSTFLDDITTFDGESISYSKFDDTFMDLIREKVKNFDEFDFSILLSAKDLYEGSNFDGYILDIINEKKLENKLDKNMSYDNFSYINDLANRVQYSGFTLVDYQDVSHFSIKYSDDDSILDKKYGVLRRIYDDFSINANIIMKFSKFDLFSIVTLLNNPSFYPILDNNPLLSNYIKYRIFSENNKRELVKLLFLDFSHVEQEYYNYIVITLNRNNLILDNNLSDDKKKIK